jgi:hypothetical protein
MIRARPAFLGVLAAAAVPVSSAGALARDETGAMLRRASEGRTPTFRDRELAAETLAEWVYEAPADLVIRRALERIVQGMPPAPEQMAVIRDVHVKYSAERARAVVRQARSRSSPGGRPPKRAGEPSTPGGGLGRWWRRADGSVFLVLAAGGLVTVLGAAWLIYARSRRA